eukprot:6193134-Pleurochrysis_carterae.AAC.2
MAIGEKVGHSNERGEREEEYNRQEEKELNKGKKRERQRRQLFMWNRHLYHALRYTGGKGKEGGFWRRRDIRQVDCILNKIARDNRRARRKRVIEIREEQRSRAEERLKGIRREMHKNSHTDALVQRLMRLRKGAGNVVTRVFDIIKKAGGNGVNMQRGIAGVYQEDDKSKPIIRGPGIRGEVHTQDRLEDKQEPGYVLLLHLRPGSILRLRLCPGNIRKRDGRRREWLQNIR